MDHSGQPFPQAVANIEDHTIHSVYSADHEHAFCGVKLGALGNMWDEDVIRDWPQCDRCMVLAQHVADLG